MTKRIGLSLLLAFFCLCIFTKCSSGSSSGSSNTPNSIAGIQDGQEGVAASQLFTVTFEAPVDVSTVTNSSFFLVSVDSAEASLLLANASQSSGCNVANAVDASVSCESETTCTLTPLSELEFNTTYSLCLTSDIHYADPQTHGVFVGSQVTFTTEVQSDHAIGGSINGLVGIVTLQNNEEDFLDIVEDGEFTFDSLYPSGTTYQISVAQQPDIQTCSVANASGTVSGSAVTDVTVTCSVDTFLVGGTLSGLAGTVMLQNNSADDLVLSADGDFDFATALADTSPYEITVLTQPDIQTCSITHGSGLMDGEDITDVTVVCSVDTYSVGGEISGLSGTVVLQNNAADDLTLTADGTFEFATVLADASDYAVTILTQPVGQTCVISQGNGTLDGAEISDVAVNCTVNPPTVGGVTPNSGYTSVNTSVTISGSNFTGATQVYFGTTAADSFSVDTDTAITATSPVGTAGVVDITVVTPAGTSVISSAGEFTYINPPAIIFVSNNVSNGNLGGFSGANTICNADSNKPNSGFAAGYTYKALLNGNNATTNGVSYYRPDGTTLIATATGGNLVGTNSLVNAISTVVKNMWTGANGTNNCSNWTSNSAVTTGSLGRADASTSSYWNTGGTSVCSASTRALYCVSQ